MANNDDDRPAVEVIHSQPEAVDSFQACVRRTRVHMAHGASLDVVRLYTGPRAGREHRGFRLEARRDGRTVVLELAQGRAKLEDVIEQLIDLAVWMKVGEADEEPGPVRLAELVPGQLVVDAAGTEWERVSVGAIQYAGSGPQLIDAGDFAEAEEHCGPFSFPGEG